MSETSKFVSWWRENPDKAGAILDRRREKRLTPAGREKERQRKAAYRARQREGKRYPKPLPVHIDGRLVLCWSVGQTAEFLGIANSTLSWLEREGKIPKNHLVDARRRRWWPEPFVRWLRPFFEARRKKEISAQEFSARVWEGWESDNHLPSMEKIDA